ncbi:MAG: hypothetical protein R3C03_18810 [Pirellulaceae bacterium]
MSETQIQPSASSKSTAELSNDLPQRAVKLAAEILQASRKRESAEDRARSAQMARMMEDENGKKFTIVMADQVLKIGDPKRAASRLSSLIRHYGLPKYLTTLNRGLLLAGSKAAGMLPAFVMPKITEQVRKESGAS